MSGRADSFGLYVYKNGQKFHNINALEPWPSFHASNARKSAKMTYLNVAIAKTGCTKITGVNTFYYFCKIVGTR